VLQHVRQCLARGTDPQMNLLVSLCTACFTVKGNVSCWCLRSM
jgi:hypothetical protein